MLKYIIISCLFLCYLSGYGQTVIKGTVHENNGSILPFATVTVENPLDSAILAYAISDAKGNYEITIQTELSRLLVRFKYFNYEPQIVNITNVSQTLHFIATASVITLKEVNVTIPPIVKSKDTLSYNLNSFSNQYDRTLSDVLKKIPGIDIGKSGQILYQGRPINKFYVEGKDLMGGSYGIITNTLPNVDVNSVEIFKNHQPVKMLKDKIYSPDAAINIRLKKDISLTGRGELAVGTTPFLWQAKITPMIFTKKYQALLSYKSNNIGEDISNELNNIGVIGVSEGKSVENITGSWINIAQSPLPAIDQKRYLFNKTHVASTNILAGITKKLELRGNINYNNNEVEREGTQNTVIKRYDENGNSLNEINFSRNSSTQLKNERLNAQFTLTQNTDRNFLKNILTLQTDQKMDKGDIIINGLPVKQHLVSPSHSIQNSFSTIIPLDQKKDKTINIQSFLNYLKDDQRYAVGPLSSLNFKDPIIGRYTALNQKLFTQKFNTANSVSTSFTTHRVTFTPKLGLELTDNKLISGLTGIDEEPVEKTIGANYENNISYFSLKGSGSFEISYVSNKLNIQSGFPVKLNHINVHTPTNDFSRQLDKTTFEPNLMVDYKFSPNWKLTSLGSISYQFAPIEQLYPGYIFSELDFINYQSDVSQQLTRSVGSTLNYESALTNTFINLGYTYSRQTNNVIYNTQILENGQQVMEALNIDNPSNSQQYQLGIGKFFPDLKTNIAVSYILTNTHNNIYLDNNLMRIHTIGQNWRMKINYNQFSWIALDYILGISANQRKNLSGNTQTESLTHQLQLFITPIENHSLLISGDYSSYKFVGEKFSNPFLDIGYQYSLAKRKLDFELKCTNLLNTRTFTQAYINDIQTNQTTFNIRPLQLLLAVKFNLR